MKNKFAISLAIAAITGLASSTALAAPQVMAGDKIMLSSTPWGGTNGGGEFAASALTGNSPSFNTFCVEYSEHFYYGKPLLVSKVNTGAKNGGAGGSVLDPSGDPDGVGPYTNQWDPISSQTAYLFTKFATNSLSGYDWNGTTAEHKADSTALQLAIWYLEGEISSTVNSSVYNLYTANSTATGWVVDANTYAGPGIGQVRVLNLLRQSDPSNVNNPFDTVAQDQLYLAPVPEPETYAMLLAGLGLIGFVAKRRRRQLP
jgi:hypothetical protein